jgi:hypothetical protein
MKKHCLRVNHELLPFALGIFVLTCTGLLSPYRSVDFGFLPNLRGLRVNEVEKSAKGN